MSDSYTKLFSSITASTIVSEPLATRWLWVTMLAMSDASGNVWGSIPGLARIANITLEQCEEALACFLSPDAYSRTQDNDGRRIEPVDGGWLLLNHGKYRAIRSAEERREYMRVYMQNKRDKEKKQAEPLTEPLAMLAMSTEVTPPAPAPAPTPKKEQELYAGIYDSADEEIGCFEHDKPKKPQRNPVPYAKIVDLYHEALPMLPKIEKLTDTRKGFISARWHEDLPDLDQWRNFFTFVAKSPFLTGRSEPKKGERVFKADLEWITRPGNFAKIAEDKYHG